MLKTMLEEPSNNARKLVKMFHGRLFSIMDANTNKQLYAVHLEYVCHVCWWHGPIHSHEDYLLLQRDINAIAGWPVSKTASIVEWKQVQVHDFLKETDSWMAFHLKEFLSTNISGCLHLLRLVLVTPYQNNMQQLGSSTLCSKNYSLMLPNVMYIMLLILIPIIPYYAL